MKPLFVKKDGDYVFYQLCYVPLRNESGNLTGFVAGMKNVDDEVRKEQNAHVAKPIDVDELFETMKGLAG